MLQPRESRPLWRRQRRRYYMEGLCCSQLYITLAALGCIALLPQGLTQHNDDVFIIKPTPALHLGKEELTTVLLVNNENYGRYINVRPEVGLLTSTARTFIQEGITTEYATQVVGTTLDNGRVYAQYLKKSSRVLYDSGAPQLSVVTSWVGESLQSDAGFLPQSHNDLFDADQPDWQAIDDHLLGEHLYQNSFVGNTDYAGLRRKSSLALNSNNAVEKEKTSSLSVSYATNSKPSYNLAAQLGVLEENARKVAANKVLPIGDLPTYTIKQNYEPSALIATNGETKLDKDGPFGRNPKLIYKKLMQASLKSDDESDSVPSSRHIITGSRHFATVTYYGFADFTTVVGDSVIVFSPSTSKNNLNYAHVTSIKGEATLDAGLPQGSGVSKVPITITQDVIEPTIMQQPILGTVLQTTTSSIEVKPDAEETTTSFTFTEVDEYKSMEAESFSTLLEASETVVQTLQSEISSTQSTKIPPSVMLSRPSDEDILRIYNALANADANKIKTQPTFAENTTVPSAATTSENEVHKETSNVQIYGGATTIFFEDDPFANFLIPSKTSLNPGATTTSNTKSSFLNDDNLSTESTGLKKNTDSVSFTTSKSFETTEKSNIVETTQGEPLTTPDTQDEPNMQNILPSVLIKEIDPNNNGEMLSDCISTSQVFLTQVPKTVTIFETVAITYSSMTSEPKTEVRQKIRPTFEVKEATKYYCIQASTIQANQVESPIVSQTVSLIQANQVESPIVSQTVSLIQANQVENPIVSQTVSIIKNGGLNATEYKEEDRQYDNANVTKRKNEEDTIEIASNTTEENIFEDKTERPDVKEKKEDIIEHSEKNQSDDTDDDELEDDEDEGVDVEVSGHAEEDDEDDEEIELVYKTLYTTYTYLTTFFHDDSTSISSHTEVVTNVMTSTLGISSSREPKATNLIANINDNEVNPTRALDSTQVESTKRFVVPSEVESFIRTDKETPQASESDTVVSDTSIVASESSKTLATFYTTYTYYTTIFADGETDIMSHTEVITNIKKSTASTTDKEDIKPTTSFQSLLSDENRSSIIIAHKRNFISNNILSETASSATLRPAIAPTDDKMASSPNIPDLGDLSAITLVTDVRSSSSPGNKQIINNFESKMASDKIPQQQSIFEDQISSESNTDTDEIIPSATLLLQTSFTTFTFYTTMYSGDKTNVISRLETMTNTVTETLQPSKTIDLEGASVPITYFTTFTYWTKLAKEGQITTLSREETISNVVSPTVVQQKTETKIDDLDTETVNNIEKSIAPETSMSDESTMQLPEKETEAILDRASIVKTLQNSSKDSYKTNVLEPTTYYTTYTYYTTSYETDKTITDSRFETITNIITPTITITNIGEDVMKLETSLLTSPLSPTKPQVNVDQSTFDLILHDFRKIIDADGISTIFFTTEIRPTTNSDGLLTEIIRSSSSLLINEEKQSLQASAAAESAIPTPGPDGQIQKQYKTGIVRLIEGTRIANRTTTLYQSKVIGTVIDQRYAQIIESTSSFIFEKTKIPEDAIAPTSSADIENIQATQKVSIPDNSLLKVEGSIVDSSSEHDIESTTKYESDLDEENNSKTDEKLRFPFQTKKPPFILPLKPFSNRNRPQFAPKKNSNATIITRSDFTPTITATPALKTINRFSSIRRGSASSILSSNPALFAASTRRFGRPSKASVSGATVQASSSGYSGSSRNRFSSSSNARNSFASSSRRLGGSAATPRASFSRPSLFSSGFPGNSRLRVRPTPTIDSGEATSTTDIAASLFSSSQEEGVSQIQDEADEDEEITTESNRRQNNPLLRLRRPLNRPQGFTPARPQLNSSNNGVSLRRNSLISRSRSENAVSSTTTSTTTAKPKGRAFQPPLISQNRVRPTNSLFPPRNIFGVQKPTVVTTEENRDLSEEDTNENSDDSEYEDEDDEESDDDEEEISRRRRSDNKNDYLEIQKTRSKREADSSLQNRSNFRNRFRRPKVASPVQAEARSYEDEEPEVKEAVTTAVSLTTLSTRTRSRFGGRYSGHSSSTIAATTPASTTSNHKAIRPTRPANSNNGRAQFTLREKDTSLTSTTQKGLTPLKRPAFRRPQPGGTAASRRLPSSTVPSSSTSGKRRLKSYTSSDSTTTSRNSVTGRSRTSSTTSGRLRSTGASRDNNVGGRSRGRNNHNYNEGLAADNSGTITVTHVTPSEVTIPVVNGKITEYKQVVTAKTSTEVLGPGQYTKFIGTNGISQLALNREDSTVNYNGATEITKYVLHETPTTTITFTPTTIRGRKTSFSHVLPSTVYSVEQVVSTVQPQISANAPLANILLSQLLLGNVGLAGANPLLGALGGALTQPGIGLTTAVGPPQPATPVTEYKTHVSTYVTTVYEGQSTVLPVTFQGKKILTTVFDTTAQTITATEFITDTIVTTPTVMAQPQPVVNSLLLQQLLLQQHLQQQQQFQQPAGDSSLNALLNSVPSQFLLGGDTLQELEASNNIRGSGHGDLLNEDDDFAVGSSVDLDDIALQAHAQTHKNGRKKSRKNGKSHKRKNNNNAESQHAIESSVITLYVSGRRPGEFSTVLSTVQVRPESTQYKRHAHTIDTETDYLNEGSEIVNKFLDLPPEIILFDGKDKYENDVIYGNENVVSATQPLESIVGDVSLWYATQTTESKTNTIENLEHSTKSKNPMTSYYAMENLGLNLDLRLNSSSRNFFA